MFIPLTFVLGFFACKLVRCETVLTGQYACSTQGNYILCNNQWGIAGGIGSQIATLISTSGNDISWSTTWDWANNKGDVKTYTNVESTTAKGMLLSDIASVPTVWSWEYISKSSGICADVSYDIWFGTTPDGLQASYAFSYEIMIWLSSLGGVEPVGSLQTSDASIGGHTWNVWKGPNSNWETISFVSQDGDINDFNTDLKGFFTWLINHEGIPSSIYLQVLEAGTEPFTGSAELLTRSYSVSVRTVYLSILNWDFVY